MQAVFSYVSVSHFKHLNWVLLIILSPFCSCRANSACSRACQLGNLQNAGKADASTLFFFWLMVFVFQFLKIFFLLNSSTIVVYLFKDLVLWAY